MRHTINFHYPINYVRYQHIKPSRAYGKASVEVEIAEVKRAETQLVFEVGNPFKKGDSDPFARKESGDLRKVISVGGRFYAEFDEADSLSKKLDDPYRHSETPFADLQLIQFGPQDYYDQSKRRAILPTTTIDDIRMQYRKWSNGKQVSIREELTEDDHGQGMAEKIRKRAAEVIVVDGVLYKECREPILTFKRHGSSLLILNAPEPGTPYQPYSEKTHPYGTHGSSLKDAGPFIQFLKSERILKNGDAMPDFKVHDASFCRYDGSTIDTIRLSRDVFDQLVDRSRALSKEMLEVRFALGSILNEEEARLQSVSPKLVQWLTKLADSVDEPITAHEALLARYHLLTGVRDNGGSTRSQSEIEKLSFHVAAARLKKSKGLDHIRNSARLALKRWDVGAGFDRLDIRTTDSMMSCDGDIVVREVNSAWQLRMLCDRAGWNFDKALAMVEGGYQLFEVDRLTIGEAAVEGQDRDHSAVVGMKHGALSVLCNVDQTFLDPELIDQVERHVAVDLENKQQAQFIEEFGKGF